MVLRQEHKDVESWLTHTRFFGSPTCGLTTGNTDFTLSDGGILVLAESHMADRSKTIYEGPVQPDEAVADSREVVQRAIAWLRAR